MVAAVDVLPTLVEAADKAGLEVPTIDLEIFAEAIVRQRVPANDLDVLMQGNDWVGR